MQKVDSLVLENNSIKLTSATMVQIAELLRDYNKANSIRNNAKYRFELFGLIEDLINSELPKLISEDVETSIYILKAVRKTAEAIKE